MKATKKRTDEVHGAVVVLTSAGGEAEARELSFALVGEGLAACVTRTAVRSVFRWGETGGTAEAGKGAGMPVCEEEEVLLVIKTSQVRVEALEERVRQLHSYDCPELIRVQADAVDPDYLEWLVSACGGEDGTGGSR